MAAGQPAFSGSTLAVIFDALLHRDPVPVSDLSPHLPVKFSEVVFRALEKDRERRYPNALALLAALKGLKQDIQSGQRDSVRGPETPVTQISPTLSRIRAVPASARLRRQWVVPLPLPWVPRPVLWEAAREWSNSLYA